MKVCQVYNRLPMSANGYKRRFGPRRWYDRSTPESRPSSGNVRFLGVEVRSTSDSRRTAARHRARKETNMDEPYPKLPEPEDFFTACEALNIDCREARRYE